MLAGGFLAFISLFLVLPFLLGSTGISGFVIGFLASLIPLGTVLLTVRFIDRWEPEPKPLLLFAFVWGAVVSIAVTMLIQPYFSLVAGPASGLDYTTFAVTVQAPVVEEFAKSLGLLLLLLFARKHFDGPVDGVVFAFTIAAGFAFTENILYFGRAIAASSDPGTDLAVVFFLRGVMSPFAHAIFTGTTGLIMGFAARRWHNGLSVLAFFVGLVPAMLLHSAWNSMGEDFLAQYVLVQVPIFLLAVLVDRAAAGRGAPAHPPAAQGIRGGGLVHRGRGGDAGHRRRAAFGPALGQVRRPGPADEGAAPCRHPARLHPAADPQRPGRAGAPAR